MAGGKQYIALPVGEGPIVDELIVVFFVIGSKPDAGYETDMAGCSAISDIE